MTATIVGLAIALLGPMLVAIGSERFISPQSPFVLHVLAIGVYVAIVASVLFIVFHYEHQSLPSLGIRPFRRQTVVWGLLLAAFFYVRVCPGCLLGVGPIQSERFRGRHGKDCRIAPVVSCH